MGFLDWLVADSNPSKGIVNGTAKYPLGEGEDARSKLDKLAGVKVKPHVACDVCNAGGYGHPCKCDPKLGRPRKWYE